MATKAGSLKPRDNKMSQDLSGKVDLAPDAWPKFEALVKSAAKMGHKPHASKTSRKSSRG
jgi:hypothetical protein